MKSNKTAVTNKASKQQNPQKMQSALTNLARIVPTAPPPQAVASPPNPPKKSRVAKPTSTETEKNGTSTTTIEAKIDVGFGNALFIRGEGAGLSWEKGVPLDCRDNSTWLWSGQNGRGHVEFKLLLNDAVWADGANLSVKPGEKVQVVPRF